MDNTMDHPSHSSPRMPRIVLAVLLAAIFLAVGLFGFLLLGEEGINILPIRKDDNPPDVVVYGPGQSRHLLLGNATIHIILEVDYVQGYAPSQTALDTLVARMREITGKSVTLELGNQIPGKDDYTRADLEAIESEHRSVPEKDGGTASVYILYLNGVYDGNSGILGLAYNGTSMAIMKEQVDNINIPMVLQRRYGLSTEDFEASVIVHEMGHLWGLVNIGYESERDYEDPDHPHHSKHQDCVMYWAIETSPGNYMQADSEKKPPTTFHEDALFDIEKIKLGEY